MAVGEQTYAGDLLRLAGGDTAFPGRPARPGNSSDCNWHDLHCSSWSRFKISPTGLQSTNALVGFETNCSCGVREVSQARRGVRLYSTRSALHSRLASLSAQPFAGTRA